MIHFVFFKVCFSSVFVLVTFVKVLNPSRMLYQSLSSFAFIRLRSPCLQILLRYSAIHISVTEWKYNASFSRIFAFGCLLVCGCRQPFSASSWLSPRIPPLLKIFILRTRISTLGWGRHDNDNCGFQTQRPQRKCQDFVAWMQIFVSWGVRWSVRLASDKKTTSFIS